MPISAPVSPARRSFPIQIPLKISRLLTVWLYCGVKEIIVSESGAAFKDELVNGAVNDEARVDYYQQYLLALLKAKKEGVNIKGFFAWTLTDNFEWAEGYKARFGLIHVDFDTQLRTIKDSGYWFRDWLTAGGR